MLTSSERSRLEAMASEMSQIYHRLFREAKQCEDRGETESRDDLLYTANQLKNAARVTIQNILANTAPMFKTDDLSQPVDVSTMTESELRETKIKLYEASADIRHDCCMIAKQLGEYLSVRHGPKWEWLHGSIDKTKIHNGRADLIIYYDGYGSYMTVTYKGNRVCSTHGTSEVFVPGEWVNIVNEFAPKAYQVAQDKKDKRERDRVETLRAELS